MLNVWKVTRSSLILAIGDQMSIQQLFTFASRNQLVPLLMKLHVPLAMEATYAKVAFSMKGLGMHEVVPMTAKSVLSIGLML